MIYRFAARKGRRRKKRGSVKEGAKESLAVCKSLCWWPFWVLLALSVSRASKGDTLTCWAMTKSICQLLADTALCRVNCGRLSEAEAADQTEKKGESKCQLPMNWIDRIRQKRDCRLIAEHVGLIGRSINLWVKVEVIRWWGDDLQVILFRMTI